MKYLVCLFALFAIPPAWGQSVDHLLQKKKPEISSVCADFLEGSFLFGARELYRRSHRVTREAYPGYDGSACDQYLRNLGGDCASTVNTVATALARCWGSFSQGCVAAVVSQYGEILAAAGGSCAARVESACRAECYPRFPSGCNRSCAELARASM